MEECSWVRHVKVVATSLGAKNDAMKKLAFEPERSAAARLRGDDIPEPHQAFPSSGGAANGAAAVSLSVLEY